MENNQSNVHSRVWGARGSFIAREGCHGVWISGGSGCMAFVVARNYNTFNVR